MKDLKKGDAVKVNRYGIEKNAVITKKWKNGNMDVRLENGDYWLARPQDIIADEVIDSSLISGKEALKALADGQDVEYCGITNNWFSLNDEISSWKVSEVLNSFDFADKVAYKFRLKPRTISINGIEVPAPFEPKEGELYWYLHTSGEYGYDYALHESSIDDLCWMKFGAWRTEEEIKQVVEALRSVFK